MNGILREAAEFMLQLVESSYGTDHEPDPDNGNDAGAWEAEVEFRRHRDVIHAATIAALSAKSNLTDAERRALLDALLAGPA